MTLPNVGGANVTLDRARSIGSLAPAAPLAFSELDSGTLSADQIGALALATAPGDVTLIGVDSDASVGTVSFVLGTQCDESTLTGTDEYGHTVQFTLQSVDGSGDLLGVDGAGVAVTLTGLSILQIAPFFVSVQGSLNTDSSGATFIQSMSADLAIGLLNAGGEASVVAPGTISSAGTSSTQVSTGGDLRLLAGSGNLAASVVGTTVTPLVIDVGGVLRSAGAGGILSLQQASGNLTFDAISAGVSATLDVPAGSLFQNTPGITDILAPTLSITVETAVGTTTDPVYVQVSGDTSVTAPSGVYLGTVGPNNPLSVGTITATAGDVELLVGGDTTLGTIDASGTVTIFADGGIYESGDALPVPTSDAAATPNIVAESGVLKSLIGIGTQTDQLETDFANLAVRSFGEMWLINYGNLTVDQITGSPITGVTTTGALYLTTYSNLTVDQPFDSGGGPIVDDSTDGYVQINAPITSDGATITVIALDNVAFGTYTDPTTLVTTIGSLDSGLPASSAAVSVTSIDGSILDGNGDTTTDVTGGQITLSAGTDIGTVTDPLLVDHTGSGDIGTLSATNNLYLTQTGGPLQIKSATATNGDLVLTDADASSLATDQNIVLADNPSSATAGGSATLRPPEGRSRSTTAPCSARQQARSR